MNQNKCTCIRIDCFHDGPCENQGVIRGAACSECRFYDPAEDRNKSWLRGDWMQTSTGGRFYPSDPRPGDIDGRDIAHSLSLICRYAGHISRFYSVAEHCILMSHAVAPENALHALLHDATEAFISDVPKPVKNVLPGYVALEERIWYAIAVKFGVDLIVPEEVHQADKRILVNEIDVLMPGHENWPNLAGLERLPVEVRAWSPARAELEYATRLKELTDGQ